MKPYHPLSSRGSANGHIAPSDKNPSGAMTEFTQSFGESHSVGNGSQEHCTRRLLRHPLKGRGPPVPSPYEHVLLHLATEMNGECWRKKL